MTSWLAFILFIILFSFLIETMASILNLKALSPQLPFEFTGIYNINDYAHSQEYTKSTTSLSLIENGVVTLLTLLFLLVGGFNSIDLWARSFAFGEIVTGLLFIGTLLLLSFILSLPFSLYSTFVIEERFGFNQTTPATYFLDILKTTFLLIIIGIPILSFILWLFINSGSAAWIYCWAGIVIFSLILQFLAPVLILPLFNTFSPLNEGSLLEMILSYTKKENFKIKGIYTMDGSKRSSKINAFFTGLGRFKKIVFYDTLLKKLEKEEVLGVLAHEMGHFKKKHILKMMLGSVIQTGVMLYLFSFFQSSSTISAAFQMDHISTYSGLVFFGFIYSPVSLILSLYFNNLSRKHEFEADSYAAKTLDNPQYLMNSLKKLSQANLTNLTPHPLYVFMHYSHPPVLERIKELANMEN